MKTHWRLPRGVDELLPPAAWELEQLRRQVLNLFVSWGFEYVEPPVIEYLDSLLVGSGEDLDLQTLKVVDQVTGRQLGVRSDMTSQAVRIDAHSRVMNSVQRLCYCGPVVFANPQLNQSSRVPIKAGAEIFGEPSLQADAQVIALMLEAAKVAEVTEPVLLLGHMGIYHGLVDALVESGELDCDLEPNLFKGVQRKSANDIKDLLPNSKLTEMLVQLPHLMLQIDGLQDVELSPIRQALDGAPAAVLSALDELCELVEIVLKQMPTEGRRAAVRVDVAELSGYGYHNGAVFAVYHPEHGSAIAQGGRYDNIGEKFGNPRPATGFDMDLKILLNGQEVVQLPVFAPFIDAKNEPQKAQALHAAIHTLRAEGGAVQVALSASEKPATGQQQLVEQQNSWEISN